MARRAKIRRHHVFWTITGIILVYLFCLTCYKVWRVEREPAKVLREEEKRKRYSTTNGPSVKDAVDDSAHNMKNIKEGNFLAPAKWPKAPEKRTMLVPVDNGYEKGEQKETTNTYYGDSK